VGESFHGLAAEDERGEAAPAVRGHYDEIAASAGGGIDDRLVWVLVDEGGRLACHAGRVQSRCATPWGAVSWPGNQVRLAPSLIELM
jgi:hypothetical protein